MAEARELLVPVDGPGPSGLTERASAIFHTVRHPSTTGQDWHCSNPFSRQAQIASLLQRVMPTEFVRAFVLFYALAVLV